MVVDGKRFTDYSKSASDDEVIVLSRCLTDRCSECTGAYVSLALCKQFNCNCLCHARAQSSKTEELEK